MGLGNPGPEYADTRHNAGFRLLDHLAGRWGAGRPVRQGRQRTVTIERYGHTCRLVKPLTYMNRSGAALAPLRAVPDFDPAEHLLVLVDDVALPLGRFRLRRRGSAGGHNGLKSIEGALLSQEYGRLRIGIGPPPEDADDLSDFVLSPFSAQEREVLNEMLGPMGDAADAWLAEGIDHAMNLYNR